MILGIEASNIRSGGGVTHLKEFLWAYNPDLYKFKKVVVWANANTLKLLPDADWLDKRTHSFLEKSIFFRIFWQRFILDQEIKKSNIDILFVPGGMYYSKFRPVITMSRNMLPFEEKERNRYGFSYMKFRLTLLEKKQGKAFTDADGLIFLTQYAKNAVEARLTKKVKSSTVIAHGISPTFSKAPRPQKDIFEYNEKHPLEILYVSIINVYKHQKSVVPAVVRLHNEGYPVVLKLVGPNYPPEMKLLNAVLQQQDPLGKVVQLQGSVSHAGVEQTYHNADLFVFASSCENLPNILVEAMASGLPIASSNKGPMPEVLQDGGLYFDPENEEEIYTALKKMLDDKGLREVLAARSFELSKAYSWRTCANLTIEYLNSFANKK
jgi:glycosyltransferase involved in cell wall biosynthesis